MNAVRCRNCVAQERQREHLEGDLELVSSSRLSVDAVAGIAVVVGRLSSPFLFCSPLGSMPLEMVITTSTCRSTAH